MKTVLAFLACVGLSQALYFHIGETEQKCFIEEVPPETMIVGKAILTQIRAHFIVLFFQVNIRQNSMNLAEPPGCQPHPALGCTWRSKILRARSYCRDTTQLKEGSRLQLMTRENTSYA